MDENCNRCFESDSSGYKDFRELKNLVHQENKSVDKKANKKRRDYLFDDIAVKKLDHYVYIP
jgi:hypothetical protein